MGNLYMVRWEEKMVIRVERRNCLRITERLKAMPIVKLRPSNFRVTVLYQSHRTSPSYLIP